MILKSADHVGMPFRRRGNYILVNESSAIDLYTTAMLLQRFSYAVCTARNPRHALDLIAVSAPSLLIVDLELPGMTGLDLLKVLASHPHTLSIPRILLLPPDGSGGKDRDNAQLAGHYCMQKPVDIEDFYRAVQSVLEQKPRKHLRVPVSLPVIMNNAPLDGERGECATHLSSQGMFIRTFRYHGPNEHLSLQLTIGGRLVSVEAAVIYSRRQDAGLFSEPGMAVRFTDITPEDQEIIQHFVRSEALKGIMTITR